MHVPPLKQLPLNPLPPTKPTLRSAITPANRQTQQRVFKSKQLLREQNKVPYLFRDIPLAIKTRALITPSPLKLAVQSAVENMEKPRPAAKACRGAQKKRPVRW